MAFQNSVFAVSGPGAVAQHDAAVQRRMKDEEARFFATVAAQQKARAGAQRLNDIIGVAAPGATPTSPAYTAPSITAPSTTAPTTQSYQTQQIIQPTPLPTLPNRFEAGLSRSEQRLNALLDDPDSIQQSAAYKFRVGQGQEALQRQMAAKGMLGSGNRLMELTKYGQDMASQEYDNQATRLSGLVNNYSNSWLGDKNANTSFLNANTAFNSANISAHNANTARAAQENTSALGWSILLAKTLSDLWGGLDGGGDTAQRTSYQMNPTVPSPFSVFQ